MPPQMSQANEPNVQPAVDLTQSPSTRKILLDVDPGVADALAMCLALNDSRLEVVAVTATGGNVPPEQATRNVQTIVEQLDPARWPRIGAADPMQPLRTDNRALYGSDGLCGADFRYAELHHRHSSVKLIADEIRAAPGQLTIIAGGPLSNIAAALKREPDLAYQIGHLVIVGGTLSGLGNVTAAAEFNIYCDAEAAKHVFHAPVTRTLLPVDVACAVELGVGVLEHLPDGSQGAGKLLHEVMPNAFLSYRQNLGVEAITIPEAIAVVAAVHPEIFTTQRIYGDVETAGSITHGATVFDRRRQSTEQANLDVVVEVDVQAALDCILRMLNHPQS